MVCPMSDSSLTKLLVSTEEQQVVHYDCVVLALADEKAVSKNVCDSFFFE